MKEKKTMKRTYAYNSVILGAMLGLAAWAATENVTLGVVAFITVSIIGFIIIRLVEDAIDRGCEKAEEKIRQSVANRSREKQANAQQNAVNADARQNNVVAFQASEPRTQFNPPVMNGAAVNTSGAIYFADFDRRVMR